MFQEDFSELKSYINKIESGDMDVPYETIYSYDKIVPNHPVYLYLRGLIEIDGNIIYINTKLLGCSPCIIFIWSSL